MNSLRLKRLASGTAAALILVFVGYQIYHAHFVRQKTEIALYKTAEQSITATGYAIRQESLVTNHNGGVLQYDVADGGKVDKGGTVAHAYKSVEDAGILQKKERLTEELTALQELASQGSYVDANADNLDSLLDDQLLDTLKDAQDGDADISTSRLKLLSLLNQKQLAAGQVKNFSARISTLQKQISALSSSGNGEELGEVQAGASGYFSSHTDGYESTFSYTNVKELFPADLTKTMKPAAVSQNTVGRICSQFNWYFACVVDAGDAAKLEPETSVELTFPSASSASVTATVVRINQKTKTSSAAVIFECNTMNGALINLRHETAKITIHSYRGIQISQQAVHFRQVKQKVKQNGQEVEQTKTVEGVYVMYGIEMKFKQIVPLYSDGTYIYCDPDPDPSLLVTSESVQLYDEVIVEGKGLSDGKIIE
ncbi:MULTISPECIES: HlyD family efflux transporter periplasmic adaptor subunit [Caproicibacterium]|uniref:HlyD family efflux transporter periplasmic adaptor subunit n=1 Tax=Caproicibacterium argilliputei TaxID=3030016 RepID=A0AA97D8A8_9FIRM|nr:HlyD family efflux transporter periplasmic adaptor subunit [Caproicibacterium argilliputei]WOC31327.1 HlyD family efflux transporter periplasmic adaptor subunit [Caproicibacterium argilliputei]